jgi:serine/threonine protein kinase
MQDEGWFTGPSTDRRRYCVGSVESVGGNNSLVFRASCDNSGIRGPVALKQLPRASPERSEALLTRSAALAALAHPGVARQIETFEGPGFFAGEIPSDDDCHVLYTASAWIEGSVLGESTQIIEPRAALAILQRLAEAIAYLHSQGITHRDLHPGNVVITPQGTPIVIDLGHARSEASAGTTQVHGAVGFVPPERFNDASEARFTSDVWQLGMLAVHLLTGAPQGRRTISAVREELAAVFAPMTDFPEAAANRVCEALDADPARRPTDVERWAKSMLDPPGIDGRLRPKRRRAAFGTAALLLVTTAVGIRLIPTTSKLGSAETTTSTAPPVTVGTTTGTSGATLVVSNDSPSPAVTSPTSPQCGASAEIQTPVEEGSLELAAAVGVIVASEGLCLGSPSLRNGYVLIQLLVMPNGRPNGAIVASANAAIVLTEAQWGGYHQIGAQDGSRYLATVGAPLIVDAAPKRTVITLEHGLLVGAGPDGPYFWIPEPAIPLWNGSGAADGKMGLPTSNPYTRNGTIEQDYERGYLTVRSDDPTVHINYVDNPGAELPANPENHILRQPDGTAWFIDETRHRHWVPNGGTWNCLDGEHIVIPEEVSGFAIASLSPGPTAACK